jgi:hypothetical protein
LPISFGGKPKEDDVVSLIAAKKYARAIEVLKAQLSRKGANPTLRMQLADVLILAEKKNEAIALLLPLADQYATEGFAAKAVSVLKKVQKIDPGRRDVDSRLARLIQEKQREAVVLPPALAGAEAGAMDEAGDGGPMLEIGFSMGSISVSAPSVPTAPVVPAPVAVPSPAAAPTPAARPVEPEPLRAAEPAAAFAIPPLPALEPEPLPALALEPLPVLEAEPVPVLEAEPVPLLEAEPVALPEAEPIPVLEAEPVPLLEAEPEVEPAAAVVEDGVEDYDLLYAGEGEEDEDLPLSVEPVDEEPAAAMSAGQFADELMSLVDSVFQESPALGIGAAAPVAPAAPASPGLQRSGTQIVVSPLFRDFSVDEMVAVIEGLKLLSVERGDVILREGQPGTSLYMLTLGRARAFRKDAATGKQAPLGDIKEGAFFGEMSILTGHPRAASIVALSRCELLELDRATLDQITKTHPHVWDVLREFAEKRAASLR